ncbi:MAG: YicC family protein [Lachnospiraceae bacterium]|nr:YicC family protein [Lachnospiraceae bacterium]
MLRSMTGFGRAEKTSESHKISVEVKAVNHRYLDLNIKMPKKFNMFEAQIRSIVKDYIERGKVDMYISFEDYGEENAIVKYNKEIANEYLTYLKQMSNDFSLEDDIRVSTLSRFPDVFTMEEIETDEEALFNELSPVLEEALKKFVESRVVEGEKLKTDLLQKLDEMASHVDFIEKRSPMIIEEYKNKLTEKIQTLLSDNHIDETRIATEVTIYADKVCVDEEIVRLKSHIEATRTALLSGESVGRKLDFIAQELNREANTTLSKSTDLEITNVGIELKTLIEKIREQIQNIE